MEAVLVVFDSNVFHGDMRADRSRLRGVLDGAAAVGVFTGFVPEVVLQETDIQFTRRSKKVVRDINKALGEHDRELAELGLQRPSRMSTDPDDAARYRSALEQRLRAVGVAALPIPDDLSPAVSWAITRRKPFKSNGQGFQDAVIWLTVLDLASTHDDQIVFVSSNTRDFGDGGDPPGLAEVLRDDLEARGRARDHVRLVPGIDAFVQELGDQREAALARANELAETGAFDNPLAEALTFSRLDQAPLELGVDLDNDPQVTSWDLDELQIETAVLLPGDELLIGARARATVLLDLLIFKADYYVTEADDAGLFTLTDPDFNRHYVEAESELVVELGLQLTSDPGGADIQVEIAEVSLAPIEVIHRALRGSGLSNLLDVVSSELVGQHIAEYIPDERIESDIEEVTVSRVYAGGLIRLREIIDSHGDRHTCDLTATVSADADWVVTAPTPFDADHFASLATNEESGAPILQGGDSHIALEIDLTAVFDSEHGWHSVEFARIALGNEEQAMRQNRLSAAEEFALDLDDSDPGPEI